MSQEIVFGIEDIKSVAAIIINKFNKYRIFAFYGTLGAGKTTLIREILKTCGVKGPITSPTFTYLNCYKGLGGKSFYHFDLYRLSSEKEFFDSGFIDYLEERDAVVFIEWPEVIENLLKDFNDIVCRVKIDYENVEGCLNDSFEGQSKENVKRLIKFESND